MSDPQAGCEGARLVPTAYNGTPAYWQTRPDANGVQQRFALVLLDVEAGRVAAITVFLDAAGR